MIPLIAAGVMTAASIAQMIGGSIQRKKAQEKLNAMKDLNYEDSQAYKTALTTENLQERAAQQGLPEASMRFQEDNINRAGAAGLNTLGSLRGGVTGVSMLSQSLLDQQRQLTAMDANARMANRRDWMNARQNLQTEQKSAFDYKMGYDMLERSQYLSEMAAGRQGVNQGMQNLSNAAASAYGGDYRGGGNGGRTEMTTMPTIPAGQIGTPQTGTLQYPQ